MIRKIDETSTDSWFRRTPAAGEREPGSRTEAATVSHALAGRSQGGWDPMDIWLRYIEQPRRLRQRATSTDPGRRG